MQHLVVDDIDIYIDGPEEDEGVETIVMIHGWPDTYRLWDAQVEALKHRYRCVRFTLPGFDIAKRRRSYTLDATMRIFLHIINRINRKQPVTLMLHDWGCVFGYEFYMRNKAMVSKIIGVDVGDANSSATRRSRTLGQRVMVNGYQGILAMAWGLGNGLGDMLTKGMASMMQVPAPRQYISAAMNYPYYIAAAGKAGSYRALVPFAPRVPLLFMYGIRKPFMFHSPQWSEAIAAREGCKVVAFDTGHWPMVSAKGRFNEIVLEWLDSFAEPEEEGAQAAADEDAAA